MGSCSSAQGCRLCLVGQASSSRDYWNSLRFLPLKFQEKTQLYRRVMRFKIKPITKTSLYLSNKFVITRRIFNSANVWTYDEERGRKAQVRPSFVVVSCKLVVLSWMEGNSLVCPSHHILHQNCWPAVFSALLSDY